MMTESHIHSMPEEARIAWLDSLQGDEKLIVHCATGHRYTMVIVSVVKRYLMEELETNYRLRFLQYLDKFADARLTAEVIAMIDPMCDDGYEIVKEARKLGWQKAFDTFAKYEVFRAFVALNPSLLTAIKMCSHYTQKEHLKWPTTSSQ